MKTNILALLVILIPFSGYSAEKISGVDLAGRQVKFDPERMKSYGRVVTGASTSTYSGEDKAKITQSNSHILFCGTQELYTYNHHTLEIDSSGAVKQNYTNESKNSTVPLDLEKSTFNLFAWGLVNLSVEMLKKCTNNFAKLPRIEVPLARSETTVSHAILDSFANDGRFRKIWIKEEKINKNMIKDKDGNPLQINGETIYDYQFIKPRKHSMLKYHFDCKNDTLSVSQLIDYNEQGGIAKSENINEGKLEYSSIIPNSVGERLYNFTCKL